MEKLDWARILEYLYGNTGVYQTCAPESYTTDPEEIETDYDEEHHKIRREQYEFLLTHLPSEAGLITETTDETREIVNHLKNVDLVNKVRREDYARLELTERGFDVAHEREISKRQEATNTGIAVFTLTLVLVNIVSIFNDFWMNVGGTLLILSMLIILVIKTDIFELGNITSG